MPKEESPLFDVAIIGGGPAGSTLGVLLKKYKPDLNILVLERERFPREHVGESHLPPIGGILEEMGCWDRVEAADFPLKLGATYRWGNTHDLWDFEFLPFDRFTEKQRPGKYEGQRRFTSFQVDRAVYDQILLEFAAEKGIEVRQQTKVTEVGRDGKRITKLRLDSGEEISARYYVDCSGSSAIIRRSMDIEIEEPASLRNIAIWDYWNDADWPETIGALATKTQIMSLGYGWLWFIPISSTRTSVGLVCPADYHIKSGKRPEELYVEAISAEPLISKLTKSATRDGRIRTTKDWSYVAKNLYGDNWFLAGESAGFADPILSAGITLAQSGARELAHTLIALDQGELDSPWLKKQYEEHQQRRVKQHIRFANFWYTANGCFGDLKEMTRDIARDSGLELDAAAAFQWLGTGGFISELQTGIAGFSFAAIQDIIPQFFGGEAPLNVAKYNQFKLNLEGARLEKFAAYNNGKVYPVNRFIRDGKTLPRIGFFNVLIQLLETNNELGFILHHTVKALIKQGMAKTPQDAIATGIPYLESMLAAGWVEGSLDPSQPRFEDHIPRKSTGIKKRKEAETDLIHLASSKG